LRIAVLDRDLGGLGSLPAELEAAGVDVKVANYPEELTLLLKTPGARDLALAVCDVMAYRPDQNISALMHAWRRDRPGLVFLLSSVPDSSVELERVRRVPSALVAGQLLPRPLTTAQLLEAAEAAGRRQAKA
jgi:hypothetical protein